MCILAVTINFYFALLTSYIIEKNAVTCQFGIAILSLEILVFVRRTIAWNLTPKSYLRKAHNRASGGETCAFGVCKQHKEI